MKQSPLKFAREFEKLKFKVRSLGATDLSIFEMMGFWTRMYEYHEQKSYQSFYNEYASILLHIISNTSLSDFRMDELNSLREILSELNSLNIDTDQLKDKIRVVAIRQASINFYVGRISDGLNIVADLTGSKLPAKLDFDETEGLNEYDSFTQVCEYCREGGERLYGVLREILIDWEGEREYLCHDRINCLFVEKDSQGKSRRGRLRKLEGSVEAAKKNARTDEITFDNQLKTPDDPFVGVAYDSLKAVRKIMGRNMLRKHAKAYFHAHLAIKDSGQTFTGDSIGLAIGLLTYVQLLKPEIKRQERLLSSEVAVTGGVNEHGKIISVNEETLLAKIERVFFSPIKYLVLPQANYKSAREYLNKLQTEYPNRRLILIGSDWLSEVFCNLNIVREQKVCLGEYTVRTVYKYTRMAKVQVPLLVILIAFLTFQLFPKLSPWFDWHIEKIIVNPEMVIAQNIKDYILWKKDNVDLAHFRLDTLNSFGLVRKIGNIDGREAFIFLSPADYDSDSAFCRLLKINNRGHILWDTAFSENPTLGSINQPNHYHFYNFKNQAAFEILRTPDSIEEVLIFIRQQSGFSFCQIVSLDPESCKTRGQYWHRGVITHRIKYDLFNDGIDDLVYAAISNDMNLPVLFAFEFDKMRGVLPLHEESKNDIGSNIFYILFPKTEIAKMTHSILQQIRTIQVGNNSIEILTNEGISKAGIYYTFNDSLKISSIIPSDQYLTTITKFWYENRCAGIDSASLFYIPVQADFQYFDGENFVNYWTTCIPNLAN